MSIKEVFKNKKVKQTIEATLDKFVEMTFTIQEETEFHGAEPETVASSTNKIIRIIKRRSMEYVKEDREEYRQHVAKKTAKVAEVIEVYTELIARGYKPEEAMVEIGEKIDFDINNTEDQDYDYDKYNKDKQKEEA